MNKRTILKKTISTIMILILVLSGIPIKTERAKANVGDTGITSDGFRYYDHGDGITIKGYNGTETDIAIPSKINGKDVTAIGEKAFYGCSNIVNIEIPESVDKIGIGAFQNCTNLLKIEIPNSVTELEGSQFERCTSLTEVILSDNITFMGPGVFKDCISLASLILPEKLEYSLSSFDNCTSLEYIQIPTNVKVLSGSSGEGGIFVGCTKLKEIDVAPDNEYYSTVDGILFSKDKFELCKVPEGKKLEKYSIPESVKIIANYSFYNCSSLFSIEIPEGVSAVWYNAFGNCGNLSEVIIYSKTIEFDESVFVGCDTITVYGYKDSTAETYATDNGFAFVSLVENPSYYTYDVNTDNTISITGYSGNSQEKIIVPEYIDGMLVTHIQYGVFNNHVEIKEIVIPDSVTKIDSGAFAECSGLTCVKLPKNLSEISTSTFNRCTSLINVIMPVNLISIGGLAFESCINLEKITIPDTVIDLGLGAFHNCKKLKEIRVPASVEGVGGDGFFAQGCDSLKSIDIDPDNQKFCSIDGVVFNKDKTILIFYPAGKEDEEYIIPNGVNRVYAYSFFRCQNIRSVEFPTGLTQIMFNTCEDCANMKKAVIPSSVTKIEENAVGYTYDSSEYKYVRIEGFTIYGYTGSAAETYATKNGFSFVSLGQILDHEHLYKGAEEIVTEASCKQAGLKKIYCADPNCDDYTTEEIPPNAHLVVDDYEIKAKCEKDGVTAGSHCVICGEIIKVQSVIPATGHSWDAGSVTKAATCTEAGYKTFTCTNCGEKKYEVINATGHTVATDPAVAATCLNPGKTAGTHCSTCGEIIVPQQITPAKGHTWDEGKVTKEPTCALTGIYTFTCSDCGETKDTIIAAIGHRVVVNDKVEPTMSASGSTAYSYCSVCFEILSPYEILPPIPGHKISFAGITEMTEEKSGMKVNYITDGCFTEGEIFFSVECDKPCYIAYSVDGGETYERLAVFDNVDMKDFGFVMNVESDVVLAIGLIGDVNLDGKIDSADALQILRYDVGKTTFDSLQKIAGNINVDGKLDSADALQILRFDVGKTRFSW